MSLAANLSSLTPAIVDQALTQGAGAAKATKKAKSQQVAVARVTKKKSWHVSEEAIQRVGVHATMEGKSESAIVDEALRALKRWALPGANTRANQAAATRSDTPEDRQDGQAA